MSRGTGGRPSIHRIYVVAGGFSLLLMGLMARLFDLQILHYAQLAGLAERQHQRTVELRGKRGTIFDRRMRELALSIDRESVYANPAEFSERPESVALVARALGLDESGVREKLRGDRQFVWLKRKAARRKRPPSAAWA